VTSRAARRVVVGALSACGATACGSTADEFAIRVDSVTVSTAASPSGQVFVQAHGRVGDTECRTFKRVDKATDGDTLSRRFIGEDQSGSGFLPGIVTGAECAPFPVLLRYDEPVPNLPARTVVYRVVQPDGTLFLQRIVLPVP
jgi:hypothetical protein